MPRKSLYHICIHDILLTAAFAAAALILLAVFFITRGSDPGKTVLVTVDGKEYGIYALDQDQEIVIQTDRGYNTLIIRDGKVSMADADCPDKYCISKGTVFRSGDTIVCLPHRVVAEIRSEDAPEEEYDIISQ